LEVLECLSEETLDNIAYIELISLASDVDVLFNSGLGVPVSLVMSNPSEEFSQLYRHSELLAEQPVRVSIPVVSGFSKAVRLAVSLNFVVKLEVGQPDRLLVDEMLGVLEYYLHNATASQPIEFFHSIFMAFYHGYAETLWEIQEEHPAFYRYVSDEGEEVLSNRFSGNQFEQIHGFSENEIKQALLAKKGDCHTCDYMENCWGYFKWPGKEYNCEGIKFIFQTLKDSAGEVKKNLDSRLKAGGVEES
jgi:hypothetical protein